MAEAKGLSKPVKLKSDLAAFLGKKELPGTEITKKLWDYIKANKLQTKSENGKPENAGMYIVADEKLLTIFKNTKSKSNKEIFDYKKVKHEKPFTRLAKILGGKKVLQKSIQSQMDLVTLSDKGITKDALLHLAKYLSFSMNQMAQLLPVTERTIQRYTSKKHFNRVVSEQILQIAEVAAKGSEVFESREKFLNWMNHPNMALDKKTPMSLLNSKFGVDMVLDELGRIEHGVFS